MMRSMAPCARWRVAICVLLVAACHPLSAHAEVGESVIRIPLHRLQEQQPRSTTGVHRRLAHVLRHQQVRARRRALEQSSDGHDPNADDFFSFGNGALAWSESPLGVGYGTHYAELYLGLPPQRASVIVDTGSHLTALPCSECQDCGEHTDPLFDVAKSTTAKYMTCDAFGSCNQCQQDRCLISQRYTEGSMWQAVVVDELVWVGSLSGGDKSRNGSVEAVLQNFGFRFPVGCQTKETGLFITQKENGIMGLGRHRATVIAHMLAAGRVQHDVFTLCFASDGGSLVLGGVDYSHHSSVVSYTPLLTNKQSSYYPVHVKDIWVNGASLKLDDGAVNSGKGVIVDSGTTDTFFVASGKRAFVKAFREASGGKEYNDDRMQLTDEELQALPIISIILDGMSGNGSDDVQLDIPASKYLILAGDEGLYYGNFHFSERSGGVLGASAMIGYDVVFDGESARVGFAKSACGGSLSDTSGQEDVTTSTPAANYSSDGSNANASAFNNAVAPSGSTKDGTSASKRSSPAKGGFMAEIILISLVGVVLAVMVWTRRRSRGKRNWEPIPEESSRARDQVIDIGDDDAGSSSPSAQNQTAKSPRSRIAPSPKFTIGSSGEEDDEEEVLEEDDAVAGGSNAHGARTEL